MKVLADTEETTESLAKTEIMRRLERRLKYRLIDVTLRDDMGEFTLQIRPMSIAEARRLQELRAAMGPTPDPLKANPLDDEFCQLLADLCYDKSLDFNYWKSGNYGVDVPAKLVMAATSVSVQDEDQIRFLPKPSPAKASSSS
jgi:hypothetical protein